MKLIDMDEQTPPLPPDPRRDPDFVADLFPLCEGTPLPPEPDGATGRAKLELGAAFYRLNVAAKELRDFRQEHGKGRDREIDRRLLQEIERALLAKEAKEDELVKSGICAVPTFRRGVVINLEFCDPSGAGSRTTIVEHSSSARFEFNIPLPWDEA